MTNSVLYEIFYIKLGAEKSYVREPLKPIERHFSLHARPQSESTL